MEDNEASFKLMQTFFYWQKASGHVVINHSTVLILYK